MTPAQLEHRNARVAEGQRRAWADPEIRARRIAAIRAGKDDPLCRAIQRQKAAKQPRDEKGQKWI